MLSPTPAWRWPSVRLSTTAGPTNPDARPDLADAILPSRRSRSIRTNRSPCSPVSLPAHALQRDPARAQAAVDNALALNPNFAPALNGRGVHVDLCRPTGIGDSRHRARHAARSRLRPAIPALPWPRSLHARPLRDRRHDVQGAHSARSGDRHDPLGAGRRPRPTRPGRRGAAGMGRTQARSTPTIPTPSTSPACPSAIGETSTR